MKSVNQCCLNKDIFIVRRLPALPNFSQVEGIKIELINDIGNASIQLNSFSLLIFPEKMYYTSNLLLSVLSAV